MKSILLWLALAAGAQAAPRVILLHDDAAPMQALGAWLTRNGAACVIVEQAEFKRHMAKAAPAAIVMYVHGSFDDAVERRLIRWAEDGGRLIVVHHGMASGKMSSRYWMPFLGVRISREEEPRWAVLRGRFQLVNLEPDHYVTRHKVAYPLTAEYASAGRSGPGRLLPAVELPDTEIFLNQVFTDSRPRTILFGMRAEADGRVYTQDTGGWLMRAGKGHVFYFQPGHFARDFENPVYAQILLNAIEWRPGR